MLKATESSESSSDEVVLDIYPPSDVFGFRVRASGFDFSCLGETMGRFARENMQALATKLNEFFSGSVRIETYQKAYTLLDPVWPVDHRNESSKVSQSPFSGIRLEKVTISDNTKQFTRFSRLQRHFV
jgi:hypothetical protein